MGIASLVLGIVGIILNFYSFGLPGIVALLVSIAGIVVGAMGRKQNPEDALANAGMIVSIVALILRMILLISCVSCIACVAGTGIALGK